jgi:hypothetical protein
MRHQAGENSKWVTRTAQWLPSRFSEAFCHEIRFTGSNWVGILGPALQGVPLSYDHINQLAGRQPQMGHEPVLFCEALSGS